jgi:hypothetical protein
MTMTVQELIDALQKVKDKNIFVRSLGSGLVSGCSEDLGINVDINNTRLSEHEFILFTD